MRLIIGIIFWINLAAVILQVFLWLSIFKSDEAVVLSLFSLAMLGLYQFISALALAAVAKNKREWLPYFFAVVLFFLGLAFNDSLLMQFLRGTESVAFWLTTTSLSFYHLWLTYRSFVATAVASKRNPRQAT